MTPAEVIALQASLADEDAAMWAYGVLSPRAGSRHRLGWRSFTAHRQLRDTLTGYMVEAKVPPVAAAPGYQIPFALTSPADAAAFARRVEDACGNSYTRLVGATDAQDLRELAIGALAGCARRRVGWGGAPQTFPGLPNVSVR